MSGPTEALPVGVLSGITHCAEGPLRAAGGESAHVSEVAVCPGRRVGAILVIFQILVLEPTLLLAVLRLFLPEAKVCFAVEVQGAKAWGANAPRLTPFLHRQLKGIIDAELWSYFRRHQWECGGTLLECEKGRITPKSQGTTLLVFEQPN